MDLGDILWIVILLIATFGGGLIKGIRKAFRVEDSEEDSQPVSHPMWETEAAEFEAEEPEEDPYGQSPYFTYEAPTVEVRTSAPEVPAAPVTQPAMLAGEEFDLRKAIIYQTVMQNNYLTEENK